MTFVTAAGQSALIELGVTSGLSLVFALLQQNWSSQQNQGNETGRPILLCNQVLQTALDVLMNLGPLSLATPNNAGNAKDVAEKSLNQVTEFLQTCSNPAATHGDVEGSQVHCRLVCRSCTFKPQHIFFADLLRAAAFDGRAQGAPVTCAAMGSHSCQCRQSVVIDGKDGPFFEQSVGRLP